MYIFDQLRLGQREKVVVALESAITGSEARAPEMGLIEGMLLDLRAHRPVENENSFARRGDQGGAGVQRKPQGERVKRIFHRTHSDFLERHNHINMSLCLCKGLRFWDQCGQTSEGLSSPCLPDGNGWDKNLAPIKL